MCLLSGDEGGLTHPANEVVDPLKPRSELFVGLSVILELCDGVKNTVKGATAGKALEEDAEFLPCLLHDRIIAKHALGGASLILTGRLGSIKVCLECVEEPGDRALVRGVRLALGNNLDRICRAHVRDCRRINRDDNII